ncbi:MAG: four helix bundle protein [Smithellaceae bacterium]|jgi:four helix bundle protein
MKVQSFEGLIAWQKARDLTKQIYCLTRREPLCRDFGLCSQMQRASVSIMANLAEGFERGSSAEFHQFIVISKGSCAELISHLYVALDIGYIKKEEFETINAQAAEVSRILGGLKSSILKRKLNP